MVHRDSTTVSLLSNIKMAFCTHIHLSPHLPAPLSLAITQASAEYIFLLL